MLPHHHILISRLASRFLQNRIAGVIGDRQGVGLFIRLPEFLAEQFPSLGDEDSSPPHITLFYSGNVSVEREEEWLGIVQNELSALHGPIRAALDGSVDYFEHADKERTVAYAPVRFSADLAAFKWNLRGKLMDAGFEMEDWHPLVFRPHVTLAYLPGLDMKWEGVAPVGSWEFEEVEVWDLPKLVILPVNVSHSRPKWEAQAIPGRAPVTTKEEKRDDVAVTDKMAKRLARRYLEITPPPFVD